MRARCLPVDIFLVALGVWQAQAAPMWAETPPGQPGDTTAAVPTPPDPEGAGVR